MKQTDAVVADVNDLHDGELRQVTVGKTDVLLVRKAGKYYAVGAYCTHYQAPLAEGVLSGNHVVCPWHNAYFDVTTGSQQEPPGLDSLLSYQVRVEGEKIIVSVPESSGHRQPTIAKYNPELDRRTFVILGAGAAGIHAAETLRVAGYQELSWLLLTIAYPYAMSDTPKIGMKLFSMAIYKSRSLSLSILKTIKF